MRSFAQERRRWNALLRPNDTYLAHVAGARNNNQETALCFHCINACKRCRCLCIMQHANAAPRRWWRWCLLAITWFQHVGGESDDSHQAIVDALTTGISDARGSLCVVRESLRQLRADQHDLSEAHAALQDSYSTLGMEYEDLQQRAATLSGPTSDDDTNKALGAEPSPLTEVLPRHLHSERRELSANALCDGQVDARLVVEGSGVVIDDVMVGVEDHQFSVMNAVYASSEAADSVGDLRDWLCRPIGSTFVKAFQTIDVTHAQDVEYFRIHNSDFIAVAQSKNATSYRTKSPVYRFSAVTGFELFQEIDTVGAVDLEHFTIGNANFLAVANSNTDGGIHNINSAVYRYNETTSKFELFQEIATFGAQQWHHFKIEDMHWLAVANFRNQSLADVPSMLYRFNNATEMFELLQRAGQGLGGIFDMEHFRIGDFDFLAAAVFYVPYTFTTKSVLYRYNATSSAFESFQEIDTTGGADWEHFRIGDDDFIAIANRAGTAPVVSVIYRYNATAMLFEAFQEISTHSASRWEHFRIGESDFLACASASTDHRSMVYRFNVVAQAFELVQEVATSSALSCKHFRAGNQDFLAFAEDDGVSGTARIMLCNGFCPP
mgnify:FL=1